MSKAIDNLMQAMKRAEKIRPRVGGFPYLAGVLRQAGVTRNVWSLPRCQSLFLTHEGPVVMQGKPLVDGAPMYRCSIKTRSASIRLVKAPSRSFSMLHGVPELFATTLILRHAPSLIRVAMVRSASKHTRLSASASSGLGIPVCVAYWGIKCFASTTMLAN